MNKWWRRLHQVLLVGGGVCGISILALAAFSIRSPTLLVPSTLLGFVTLYGWSIYLGLHLASPPVFRRRWQLLAFYALQVPWIACSTFAYHFMVGFGLIAHASGVNISWFLFGANFELTFSGGQPLKIGINFFALLVLLVEALACISSLFPDSLADAPNPALQRTDSGGSVIP